MSDKAFYKTAQATPGLLNMITPSFPVTPNYGIPYPKENATLTLEYLHKKHKPPKYSFYSHYSKLWNSLITRLRVDRSYLNCHAFSIGLVSSPESDCGAKQKTILQKL